jgi:hypothetical protein
MYKIPNLKDIPQQEIYHNNATGSNFVNVLFQIQLQKPLTAEEYNKINKELFNLINNL